jgi:hypothetical protein
VLGIISLIVALFRGDREGLRQKSMPFSLVLLIIEPLAFAQLSPNEMVPFVAPFLNPIVIAGILGASASLFYLYYKDIIKKRYKYPRLIMVGGMAVIAAMAFVKVEGTVAITFVTSALDYGLTTAAMDFLKVLTRELSWEAFDMQYHDLLVLKGGWIVISTWVNYMIYSTVTGDPIERFYYKTLRKQFPSLPK